MSLVRDRSNKMSEKERKRSFLWFLTNSFVGHMWFKESLQENGIIILFFKVGEGTLLLGKHPS